MAGLRYTVASPEVAFDGAELWGADAEPGVVVHLDLFEPYLERSDD